MLEQENVSMNEQNTSVAVIPKSDNDLPKKDKKIKKQKEKRVKKCKEIESDNAPLDFDPFTLLAQILDSTPEIIKEECVVYQIRKITSRLNKVVVRYNVTSAEMEKIFLNANALKLGGLSVAPIYLSMCAKQAKKHSLHDMIVSAVIDFPFGESSFRGKLANVKESVKIGADKFTVTMPSMLFTEENSKELKKQLKRLGNNYKSNAGITVNATDLSEDKIKRAVKAVSKSKLGYIIFAFGESTLNEVKTKLDVINKYRSGKNIGVIANVDSVEAVSQLIKLDVDYILTPYADLIGKELFEKFQIKSVKLY